MDESKKSEADQRTASAAAWCAALALVAFLVRVGAWRWLEPATPIADMRGYLRQAIRLATGQEYAETFVPPGYPAALGVAMRLFGQDLNAACYLNALLGGLSVVAVYLAARRLLNRGLAVVAAAVVAIDPTEVLYSTTLLSEPLAVALVTAAVACLARPSGRAAPVFGGILLGLGALTRESVVLLIPLLGIALWRARGWRPALAFAAAGFLAILPWTIRNTAVTGRPIFISSNAGYNLLIGNNPYADGSQRGGKRIFSVPDPPVPESLPAPERHWQGTDYALAWIAGHPVRFVGKGLVGALRMLGLERQFLYNLREGYYARRLGRVEKLILAAASVGSWLLVLPLAVLGLLVAPYRLRTLGLCAFLWLGLLGVAAFGEWRFRMPVLPVFVLLAVGAGDAWLRGRVGRRAWLVMGGALLPVVASWVREVFQRAQDVF